MAGIGEANFETLSRDVSRPVFYPVFWRFVDKTIDSLPVGRFRLGANEQVKIDISAMGGIATVDSIGIAVDSSATFRFTFDDYGDLDYFGMDRCVYDAEDGSPGEVKFINAVPGGIITGNLGMIAAARSLNTASFIATHGALIEDNFKA